MGVAVTAVVICCAACFVTARVADKMYGHLRVTVIGMLGLSSVFFLWFLLLSTRVITPNLGNKAPTLHLLHFIIHAATVHRFPSA